MHLMRLIPRFTKDVTHRSCRDCWADKPASEYWRNGNGALDSYCKPCRVVRSRLEYRRNGLARRRRAA